MVVSNHTTSADDVRSFGVPFFHVPSVAGPDKSASESKILELLKGNDYMRVWINRGGNHYLIHLPTGMTETK